MRTRESREGKEGMTHIYDAINKLGNKHQEHLLVYGEHNNERLTGKHETSGMDTFTYGIGSRNTSIRIGNDVEKSTVLKQLFERTVVF